MASDRSKFGKTATYGNVPKERAEEFLAANEASKQAAKDQKQIESAKLKFDREVAKTQKKQAMQQRVMQRECLKNQKDIDKAQKQSANVGADTWRKSMRNMRATQSVIRAIAGDNGIGRLASGAIEFTSAFAAGDFKMGLLSTVGIMREMYGYVSDALKEYRSANMSATNLSRQMGGNVDDMKTLQRGMEATDRYLGVQSGWSAGMFEDFRHLGLNVDQARGAMEKFQRAALPENMGVDSASKLEKIFLDINNDLHSRGKNSRINLNDVLKKTEDDVPFQKAFIETLTKKGLYDKKTGRTKGASLSQSDFNALISDTLDDNAKVKLPDADKLITPVEKFNNYVKTEVAKTLTSFYQRMSEVMDPESYEKVNVAKGAQQPDAPSFGGFLNWAVGGKTTPDETADLSLATSGMLRMGKDASRNLGKGAAPSEDWFSEGADNGQQMAAGIQSSKGDIAEAFRQAAEEGKDEFKTALGIHSPSRVFAHFGRISGEGFNMGLGASVNTSGAIEKQVNQTMNVVRSPVTIHQSNQNTITAGSAAQGQQIGDSFGSGSANQIFQSLKRANLSRGG
jgi:hypothetical protein